MHYGRWYLGRTKCPARDRLGPGERLIDIPFGEVGCTQTARVLSLSGLLRCHPDPAQAFILSRLAFIIYIDAGVRGLAFWAAYTVFPRADG